VHSQVPRQILKIARHKVVQIACGEYHTLALTQTRDVYSWGRGFEGQLGVAKKSSSVPTHLKQFFLGYSES
jgi:alpha-tubulin suppressor-like RCC1 family protein